MKFTRTNKPGSKWPGVLAAIFLFFFFYIFVAPVEMGMEKGRVETMRWEQRPFQVPRVSLPFRCQRFSWDVRGQASTFSSHCLFFLLFIIFTGMRTQFPDESISVSFHCDFSSLSLSLVTFYWAIFSHLIVGPNGKDSRKAEIATFLRALTRLLYIFSLWFWSWLVSYSDVTG